MDTVLFAGCLILIAYALAVAACLAICAVGKPRGQHAGNRPRGERAMRSQRSQPGCY